jgi:hypothetical protein
MNLDSPVFALANVLLITSAPALTLAQVRILCYSSFSLVLKSGTDHASRLRG